MKILDKITKLFRKEKVSVEDVKKVTGETSEEKKEEITAFNNAVDRSELLDVLNSVSVDLDYLAIDRIQSESETIGSYVKALIKDMAAYQDLKEDNNKIEEAVRGIGGKIRVIAVHSLELKNLLANLEEHYFNPLLEALRKVNEKLNNEGMAKLILSVENDLNLVKALDTQITRVAGYDSLFNSAKNPDYKAEIEKEVSKRIIHGELNELLDTILVAVTDRSLSVKARIERNSPLEAAKKFL